MKHAYTRSIGLCSLFALALQADAQTLTQASSVPVVGHTETRTYYSAFGTTGLATSGTGNVWDLSGATAFGTSSAISYRVPSESPFAANYPTTTICLLNDNGMSEEWRHYRVTADTAELLGSNTDVFDGGRTFCTFPFSMGSSFTDTYSINGGSPNTETDEYVATGEIIAPWGTVPNVVMFSVNGGVAYYFYSADNVLDAIGSYIPDVTADIWRVEQSNTIKEVAPLSIGVSPVPAQDRVKLDLPFANGANVQLTDATGRIVISMRSTNTTDVIDVSDLAKGVYVVRATDVAGRVAQSRLVKE